MRLFLTSWGVGFCHGAALVLLTFDRAPTALVLVAAGFVLALLARSPK